MRIPDIKQFRQEKKRWKAFGEPKRSDERVLEIYNNYCEPCEYFEKLPIIDRGQCQHCGCLLAKHPDRANKIYWATTECPIKKWGPEPGFESINTEDTPIATRDCGCPKR